MRDAPTAVMLFAAGFGTRMGALTKTRPKPLVEVAGRALLDHALDLTEGLGLRRVVNAHYFAEQIVDHLAGRDIKVSHEPGMILETGGGLRRALPIFGSEPVFTMNTDAVWGGSNPLEQLRAQWNPVRMDALLMCVNPSDAVGHRGAGDFVIGSDGRLTRGAGVIYGGVQIMKTDLLAHVAEDAFSLNIIWTQMAALGRLYGMAYDGAWCDVGTPEGVADAEALIARHV
jgi:MurNAc alpha-1-phosphate uridylyltransferase